MKTLLTLLLSTVIAVAAPAAADTTERTPEQWLEHMHRALTELNYEGELSYFHGQQLASLRIAHAVVDGVRKERLVHLNGIPREFIRDGDEAFCIIPEGDHLSDFDPLMPGGVFAQAFARSASGLPEGYRARFGAPGRVAGREVVQVVLEARDQDRYSFRLWLDRQSGLLLRSELLDLDGTPREILQFVRVVIGGDIEPSLLQPDLDRSEHSRRRVAFRDPGQPLSDDGIPWQPQWIPPGFALTGWDHSGRAGAATLMYSDGLASFTLFLEPADHDVREMSSRRGATVALTRALSLADGAPGRVTVVGEVPMATAARVAESLAPQGAGS